MKTLHIGRLSVTVGSWDGPRLIKAGWGRRHLGDRYFYLWTGAYLVFVALHPRGASR